MDGVQKVQELQRHKLVESREERGPHEPDELVTMTTTRTHTTVSRKCEEETDLTNQMNWSHDMDCSYAQCHLMCGISNV